MMSFVGSALVGRILGPRGRGLGQAQGVQQDHGAEPAWCGLRFGELAELRRADLDLDAQVLSVRRGVVHVKDQYIVGTPKSTAGSRTVAIPRHLIEPLRHHLIEHTAPGPDAVLCPGADGDHLAPVSLYEQYYPAREAAGRPDLRLHDLRHTGATLAAATGATLADLMGRLGHSTPSAALRYQHSSAARDALIADALADFAERKVVELRPRSSG
jgi:integrase